MEILGPVEYDVLNKRLRRYSIAAGSVYSFVNLVCRSEGVNYLRAHELIPMMSEEEFELVVARYKLETSE